MGFPCFDQLTDDRIHKPTYFSSVSSDAAPQENTYGTNVKIIVTPVSHAASEDRNNRWIRMLLLKLIAPPRRRSGCANYDVKKGQPLLRRSGLRGEDPPRNPWFQGLPILSGLCLSSHLGNLGGVVPRPTIASRYRQVLGLH